MPESPCEFNKTADYKLFNLKPFWVYTNLRLYYAVIASMFYEADDMRQLNKIALSFFLHMIMQFIFILSFSADISQTRRKLPRYNYLGTKLLEFEKYIDQRSDCFSAMLQHLLHGICSADYCNVVYEHWLLRI